MIQSYLIFLRDSDFHQNDVLSIVGLFYPSESMENLKELIILKPAEGAPLLDHSFNSPTFVPVIADHLETYSNRYGI